MSRLDIPASRSRCPAVADLLRVAILWTLVYSTVGCAKEPTTVSISTTTFNYSQDYLIDVFVNGKTAGSLGKPAKLGEVRGGGKVFCCISLDPNAKTAEVTIRASKQDEVVFTYSTSAEIKQPWPEIASYAVVHVLPGQKVVIEVVPSSVEPDMELLAQRIKELGLKP